MKDSISERMDDTVYTLACLFVHTHTQHNKHSRLVVCTLRLTRPEREKEKKRKKSVVVVVNVR